MSCGINNNSASVYTNPLKNEVMIDVDELGKGLITGTYKAINTDYSVFAKQIFLIIEAITNN